MNKILTLLLVLTSANSFAAITHCANKAEKAALAKAFPYGFSDGESAHVKSDLARAVDDTLIYRVQVMLDYDDGTSLDESPAVIYRVIATGTSEACVIESVKKI